MVTGNLNIKGTVAPWHASHDSSFAAAVLRVEDLKNQAKGAKILVRVTIGKIQSQTEPQPVETGQFNEILTFEGFQSDNKNAVQIEVLQADGAKPIASAKLSLAPFINARGVEEKEFNLDDGAGVIVLSYEFAQKDKGKKQSPPPPASSTTKNSSSNDPHASIPRSLTTTAEHAPSLWYIHPSFYYAKTKEVYSYATSFSAVGYVARYGESTLEYLLHRLAPKQVGSLDAVDQSLVPALTKVDSRVDENVSHLLKSIAASQDYLLKTKDGALIKVHNTVTATKSSVVSTVSSVQAKVSQVTSSTVETACSLHQKTVDKANEVRKSTVDTISSVSHSTYATLSNATHHILAHVPFINSKEKA
ncbi:hypothetical protein DYB37_003089 [Aphanomyces astaci]|uniref:Uncharacterized protein n=1 Tax=Aphanomyces astaci TaxID=112090 RepID=A0A3R7B879_APHAT|nr:hypothetical protein DYB37_003089 [Aphanomyces astaci]